MLILALDSTTSLATVSVCRDEHSLAVYTLQNGNTHSQTLLPMVQTVLEQLSLSPADMDLFACTAGPGSFTGIRIGAATIKGLAFASGTPCVGVSALEALAYRLKDFEGIICPLIGARKFIYCAVFLAHDGHLTRLCEDCVLSPDELGEKLNDTLRQHAALAERFANDPIYLTGDGAEIGRQAPGMPQDRLRLPPRALQNQDAYDIAQLAREAHAAGLSCSDRELSAIYLRPCQAERERSERLQNETNS